MAVSSLSQSSTFQETGEAVAPLGINSCSSSNRCGSQQARRRRQRRHRRSDSLEDDEESLSLFPGRLPDLPTGPRLVLDTVIVYRPCGPGHPWRPHCSTHVVEALDKHRILPDGRGETARQNVRPNHRHHRRMKKEQKLLLSPSLTFLLSLPFFDRGWKCHFEEKIEETMIEATHS